MLEPIEQYKTLLITRDELLKEEFDKLANSVDTTKITRDVIEDAKKNIPRLGSKETVEQWETRIQDSLISEEITKATSPIDKLKSEFEQINSYADLIEYENEVNKNTDNTQWKDTKKKFVDSFKTMIEKLEYTPIGICMDLS